jgi:tetratricopeptide (TPR) repeat protein
MSLSVVRKARIVFLLIPVSFLEVSCVTLQRFQTCMENMSVDAETEEKVIINATDEFFLKSDQLFSEGRYRRALQRARRIYRETTEPSVKEEALFRIALLLSYGDNPNRDYEEAEKTVRKFLHDYPESKRRFAIRSILQLLQEVRRGTAEIQTIKGYNAIQEEKILRLEEDIRRIKEIDLQLEEQKKKLE